MANREHLAMLGDGAEVWNAWRRNNPKVQPDLNGADLCATDLMDANLNYASFRVSKLRDAELAGASSSVPTSPEDMKIGDRIRTRIGEVIRLHEKLLLVLSENSIVSDWVEKEVETAFENEREMKSTVLFPVRLDAAVMDSRTGWAADIKRSRHIGDFTDWRDHDAYQKVLKRLLRDLTIERCGTTSSAPSRPSG